MTSEGERSEPSEKPSGEERSDDPRGSEDDRSEPSEKSSGERSEPRGSGDDRRESPGKASGEERSDDPRASEERPEGENERTDGGTTDGGATDDVPLNIAGHDAEKERRQEDATDEEESAGGDDAESAAEADEDGVLSEFDVADPRGENGEVADDEVEPVELLVQLAEDGEIDPWDIDVVTVTDKFLDRLDGADLRTGGRALFYAAVLLRMKSDAMWTDDEPEEDDEWAEEPWEAPPGEADGEAPAVDPFDELEQEMDRRIERKTARGTPETLDELVRDLRERERETWWKESRSYDTSESPSGFARGTQSLDYHGADDVRMDDEPTAEDVTGTAHDEHMEDIINEVYVELQGHYDQGREEVLFAEVREAAGTAVNTFLGLLFLSHRDQIRLQQDDLFGDLWVQDPAAVPTEEFAPADD